MKKHLFLGATFAAIETAFGSPVFSLAQSQQSMLDFMPTPSGGGSRSGPKSKTTCAQMKRKSARRKAKRRARRLGHA